MIKIFILLFFIQGTLGKGFLHKLEHFFDKKCPILEKGSCPQGDEISYWLTVSGRNEVKLDVRNLQSAPFINGPLKVWFHGYSDNHDSPIVKQVIQGYTSRGQYNVLVVDWNTYTKAGCYIQSVQSIGAVGLCVGQVLAGLLKAHPFSNFHFMGHSLGSHVAAWASTNTPGLQRLTKFDPAMPLFTEKGSQRGAASFIDVYHSNCNIAGQRDPSGDVDVYFNTATFQPGCGCDIACSHARCITYFLESIGGKLIAFPCKDWDAYFSNKCPTPNSRSLVNVGDMIDSRTRGVYMAFTKDKAPFLEGNDIYVRRNIFESFKKVLISQMCTISKYEDLIKDWIKGHI